MNLDLTALAAAAAVSTIVLLGLVVLLQSLRHGRSARRLAALESDLQTLKADVAASTGIGVRAGERLRRLEQLGSQLNERLGQLELRGEGRPYDQAIALTQHGAGSERLMSEYGLSRGEADLLSLMHGRRA